jgi:hypothetical protein
MTTNLIQLFDLLFKVHALEPSLILCHIMDSLRSAFLVQLRDVGCTSITNVWKLVIITK